MSRQSWFSITAKSDTPEVAEIDIFDEIGAWGVTAKQFVNDLRAAGPVKKLTLNIDCPGGDCNDGFTIFDAIKATKAEVTANITGIAASMASVIMLAAKKITIAENGRVMIHRVTTGAYGNADDVDAAAKVARQFEDRIVSLYMERTGKKEHEVRDWMKAEMGTWFFGQDAVDAGFADEVNKGTKARAFRTEWAAMFTMLPAALFDSGRSQKSRRDSSQDQFNNDSLMKLTAEQKTSLHALLRKPSAELNDTEKTELQKLSDLAKKEGYDAAAAMLKEDEAAAAKLKADAEAKAKADAAEAAKKAVTPEMQAALAATIKAEIEPLVKRLEQAEAVIRAGVHTAAGGRGALDLGGGGGEGGESIAEQFDKIKDPAARTKFFREHKAELTAAADAAKREKK